MLERQWLGEDKGTNPGSLWLELDKVQGRIEGIGIRMEALDSIAGTLVFVLLQDHAETQSIEVQTIPLDTHLGQTLNPDEAFKRFPDSIPARKATITVRLSDNGAMLVRWKSDIGTEGTATLRKSTVAETSQIVAHPTVNDWETFKTVVVKGSVAQIG